MEKAEEVMQDDPFMPGNRASTGTPGEVFAAFLVLGVTSFGGPIAHLAYFRREFVERRRWVRESEFAQLLGICQFLPGPASSQLGFSLGLLRGGWLGGIAAFTAFTLPSALLLIAFSWCAPALSGSVGDAAIHGLKIVALVVVTHAVFGMSKRLCNDWPRRAIGIISLTIIVATGASIQLVVVALGAVAGVAICTTQEPAPSLGDLQPPFRSACGGALVAAFAGLLLMTVFIPEQGILAVAGAFYRAGALVFGGGHVVLPLLEESVVRPGWVPRDQFLAGYGAAQAIPGPMFSFAAYLGACLPNGIVNAWVALGAIFLPGFLLVAGVLPVWHRMAAWPVARRSIAGVNAAVVGVLAAALYDPIFTSAVRGLSDALIGVLGYSLLTIWRIPALGIVVVCVVARIVATVVAV